MKTFPEIINISGRVTRGCNGTSLPFNSGRCTNEANAINQALRRWLFKRQALQKQNSSQNRQMRQAEMRATQIICNFFYPQNMSEYTLEDLKRRHYFADRHSGSHISIPKEFKTLLDRYSADPNYSRNYSGRDPLEVNEDLNPELAGYLRDFMEGDSIFKKLYNIDFYTNYDPNACQQANINYLDPYYLAYLLDLLRQGEHLAPEQEDFLRNALYQMGNMEKKPLIDFVDMFAQHGLLVPHVISHLRNQVKILKLSPAKKKKFLAAFKKAKKINSGLPSQKVWASGSNRNDGIRGHRTVSYEDEAIDEFDWTGYNKDGYDKDGYDKNGYNKYGYDKNGYDKYGYDKHGYDKYGYDKDGYNRDGFNRDGLQRPVQQDDRTLQDIRLQVLRAYKSRIDAFLRRITYMESNNGKGEGYFEPWDAEIKWAAAKALLNKAKLWRLQRLDLSKFDYQRGLERYKAELQHTQLLLERMEKRAATKTDMTKRKSRLSSVFQRKHLDDLTLGRQRYSSRRSTRRTLA